MKKLAFYSGLELRTWPRIRGLTPRKFCEFLWLNFCESTILLSYWSTSGCYCCWIELIGEDGIEGDSFPLCKSSLDLTPCSFLKNRLSLPNCSTSLFFIPVLGFWGGEAISGECDVEVLSAELMDAPTEMMGRIPWSVVLLTFTFRDWCYCYRWFLPLRVE